MYDIYKLIHSLESCTNFQQTFVDNKAVISISEKPVQHDRTKHVEIDRHFIKEKLEKGVVSLPFVQSKDQLVDILTKVVSSKVFDDAIYKLGLGELYDLT